MRYLIISILAISVIGASENPRLNQAIDAHNRAIATANQVRDGAISAAEARHAADTARATENTVRNLKRLINHRAPVAEQAEIYKTVLFINRTDEEAVRFFTAIGTIDVVLADIDNANMLVGKVDPPTDGPAVQNLNIRVGQTVILNAENVTETTAIIRHSAFLGERNFESWRSDQSATWMISIPDGTYSVSLKYANNNGFHDSLVKISLLGTEHELSHNLKFTGHALLNWETDTVGTIVVNGTNSGVRIVGFSSDWVMHMHHINITRIR